MTWVCWRCGTAWRLAALGPTQVWMAVAPWTDRLCAGSCEERAYWGKTAASQ